MHKVMLTKTDLFKHNSIRLAAGRMLYPALVASILITGCNVNLNAGSGASGNGTEVSSDSVSGNGAEVSADSVSGDVAGDAGWEITGGDPWIDSDIKENVVNHDKPDLKDDFHMAVNYEWLKDAEIKEGYTLETPLVEIESETIEKALDIIKDESLNSHDAQLVHDLYNTVIDWDKRDVLGIDPALPVLDDIESLSSIDELTEFISDPVRCSCVDTFIVPNVEPGYDEPDRNTVSVDTDVLILEDAAEYHELTNAGERMYEAKKGLYLTLTGKLGIDDAEALERYNSVLSFEEQIASVKLTEADRNSPEIYKLVNNVYTNEEIKNRKGNFPLYEILDGYGFGSSDKYTVMEPEVIEKLDELYIEDNLEIIKSYMSVHWLLNAANKLDRECHEAYIRRNSIIYGTTGSVSDEIEAYDVVLKYIYEPLEREYLKKYDAVDMKKDITGICEDIIDEYKTILKEEDWLSEATVDAAVNKLEHMKIRAVYPDKWTDYSGLDLSELNYVECVRAIELFKRDIQKNMVNEEVDNELWNINILDANAYYSPIDNSINIVLGILGSDVYNDNMSREQILGGIGAVIGHEISHAFDPSGSQFDENGKFTDWWTKEDHEAFEERTQKLIDYYNSITVFKDVNVNGSNVQGEAIADMASIKVMLAMAAGEDDFDYDAFFRGYAAFWRQSTLYENEYYKAKANPHPMNYLRTNVTLQQYDEFLETYGISEGDGMYLAPEDRVTVW